MGEELENGEEYGKLAEELRGIRGKIEGCGGIEKNMDGMLKNKKEYGRNIEEWTRIWKVVE